MDNKQAKTLLVEVGKDTQGESVFLDISQASIFITGATGCGKSVLLDSIITSILVDRLDSRIRLTLIDPKKIEFAVYKNTECNVISDCEKGVRFLSDLQKDAESRVKLLKDNQQKTFISYNEMATKNGLFKIQEDLLIIDELVDLLLVSKTQVEKCLSRLALIGPSVGIYLVIATQLPSAVGNMASNCEATRIAGFIPNTIDSKSFLGDNSASKLENKGEFIIKIKGKEQLIRTPCLDFDTIKKSISSLKTKKVKGDEDAS